MSRHTCSKFSCVCLVLFACILTADGHRYTGPPGCFYNLRSCKVKCCGNGKTCESTTYRGRTWYKCHTADGHRYTGPPGCFYNLRSCKVKCCGNGKTCESTTYRGRTWYKCHTVDCGSLSYPANGSVTTLAGTTFESFATYTCNEGFVLSSIASGTCLSSGHWSFTAPTCQPDPECRPFECGPLDQPCNGHVDSSGVLPGDVANYSCETGFELQGESSRTCLDGGEWDGFAPCCVKTCRQMEDYSNSYETSSYKIVSARLTWDEARLHCQEDGAKLVEIEDAGENAHLTSTVGQNSEFYWIGGKYIAEDGAWEWASDNRPFNYTAWHRLSGPEQGRTDEYCAGLLPAFHLFWSDKNCTLTFLSVCECSLL